MYKSYSLCVQTHSLLYMKYLAHKNYLKIIEFLISTAKYLKTYIPKFNEKADSKYQCKSSESKQR